MDKEDSIPNQETLRGRHYIDSQGTVTGESQRRVLERNSRASDVHREVVTTVTLSGAILGFVGPYVTDHLDDYKVKRKSGWRSPMGARVFPLSHKS